MLQRFTFSFLMKGQVIKQNCHYRPRKNLKQKHHSPKVIVWAAISGNGIIDPYFFHDENRWGALISERLFTPRVAEISKARLQNMVPAKWFLEEATLIRLPGILILVHLSIFLWGYVKSKLYDNKLRNLMELKQNIRSEMAVMWQQISVWG